jgi:hypothetical protein
MTRRHHWSALSLSLSLACRYSTTTDAGPSHAPAPFYISLASAQGANNHSIAHGFFLNTNGFVRPLATPDSPRSSHCSPVPPLTHSLSRLFTRLQPLTALALPTTHHHHHSLTHSLARLFTLLLTHSFSCPPTNDCRTAITTTACLPTQPTPQPATLCAFHFLYALGTVTLPSTSVSSQTRNYTSRGLTRCSTTSCSLALTPQR